MSAYCSLSSGALEALPDRHLSPNNPTTVGLLTRAMRQRNTRTPIGSFMRRARTFSCMRTIQWIGTCGATKPSKKLVRKTSQSFSPLVTLPAIGAMSWRNSRIPIPALPPSSINISFPLRSTAKNGPTSTVCTSRMSKLPPGARAGRSMCCSRPTANRSSAERTLRRISSSRY